MILEIAVGVVLAIILLAILPYIIVSGVYVLGILLLIAIVGVVVYFFSEYTVGALVIALLVATPLAYFFISSSLRENGGIKLYIKKIFLTLLPAITLKQKTNKNIRLSEHKDLIDYELKKRNEEIQQNCFSKLAKAVKKKTKKYESYSCLQVNLGQSSINISIENPYDKTAKSPFSISISIYVNYPYSTTPSYYLELLSDWKNNKKEDFYESYPLHQSKKETFDSIGAITKSLIKTVREKIIQFETSKATS